MDVFKLQRMNSLAAELKKHNFAQSSEDAFQQAEQVFEEKEVLVAPDVPQVVVEKPNVLAEKRFELLLEQNNRKYEQELGLLRSALNSLAQQVEILKADLQKAHEAPKQKEQQVPLKTEPKEDHPRQGKFSSADVDIQKMFYFGAKR
ncbi:MAG: hypothetical protein QW165_04105 [Candidatus Woesearchaeota archaeon]